MVTKIKPRRIKSDNPGSLGDFLGYQDEATFKRGEGGGLYTAGRGIEILNGNDYSAMRGPAPTGYHVPSKDEWIALVNTMFELGIETEYGDCMITYMKMPFAGYRDHSSADVSAQGDYANYWSSTAYDTHSAYCLFGISSWLDTESTSHRSYGLSIRAFKDTPVVPNSSWTTLYSGTGDAGIFHNSTLGLISISLDGTTWTTIADKNLGATVVYNDGDTLAESNCGYYYQWGNNYGFPRTGTITTSSTKVDASNYGPGNYYSSSTFITVSTSPWDWSSVQNDNLWGGVTGVITLNNAITNTGVLSVNGQTGDITIPTTEDINTKTFYLSSTSDLVNAQAAYDWYLAGKNPIIVYSDKVYVLYGKLSNTLLQFYSDTYTEDSNDYGYTVIKRYEIYLNLSNGTVTSISNTYSTNASFLGTSKNYSSVYTPLYNGSPATKLYVDNGDTKIAASAPSNPTQGMLWYDTTNDVLYVYDGTNWKLVGDDTNNINTKTFYLSSSVDYSNAGAALAWYKAGKMPIIRYDNNTYYFEFMGQGHLLFASNLVYNKDENSRSKVVNDRLYIYYSGDTVTSIATYKTAGVWGTQNINYLATDVDYSSPYNPQYPGSPTTKKYVDDRDTHIGTSAPTDNLVEGRLRYDTANDQLKVYDGTNRNNVNTQVTVEDNLTSTSTTNALSANQGRILDGKIADLMALGKFLSLWNASTGQPVSFPYTTPYAYSTGDYFLVSTVSSATPPVNYRPTGSSYTGTASSTAETDELEVGDVYIYDGSVWLLQSNHGKTVTFANIAGQPTDNTNLATALGNKQDTLSAGTGISISSNTVTNTGVTSFNGSTGAITYTAPVTSVNGNTGAVTVTEANNSTITLTQGGVTKGSFTTNQSSSSIIALDAGKVYNAGNHIDITNDTISVKTSETIYNTQGPAPAGYHVPSRDEWVALCGILTTTFGLARNDTTMATYLKMPMTYVRNYSTGNLGLTTQGSYWSSTAYGAYNAYRLYFDIGTVNPQNMFYRSYGFSVRCLKNSPVTPTSSWTTLYDGTSIAQGAGVFRDSTNGLISVSGDGNAWYTIMDKNLGATSTDTTSADSYGYTYQRGNNYGFPMGGTITTSSTKVDASGYGPGNRYSSSTFITTSVSPYDWSSVQNDNLRGGVNPTSIQGFITNDTTGTTTTVTAIRAGTEAEYNSLGSYSANVIYHIY